MTPTNITHTVQGGPQRQDRRVPVPVQEVELPGPLRVRAERAPAAGHHDVLPDPANLSGAGQEVAVALVALVAVDNNIVAAVAVDNDIVALLCCCCCFAVLPLLLLLFLLLLLPDSLLCPLLHLFFALQFPFSFLLPCTIFPTFNLSLSLCVCVCAPVPHWPRGADPVRAEGPAAVPHGLQLRLRRRGRTAHLPGGDEVTQHHMLPTNPPQPTSLA